MIGANMRVQGGTHAQGGSEAVSSACGGSADHGHRDEDTVQSVPKRRGAFAGWDAYGGELPYRRLLGDELAGDAVRPRPRRAWWGAGLRQDCSAHLWDHIEPLNVLFSGVLETFVIMVIFCFVSAYIPACLPASARTWRSRPLIAARRSGVGAARCARAAERWRGRARDHVTRVRCDPPH